MKKIFYLMSLCALAFISCQKEEMSGNVPLEGQYTYEFVAYQQPESKATVGDKVDDKWPVLWSEGDQIGVYKADGTFVGAATLSEGAGQNAGKFSLSSNTALAAGDALYISYPYTADAAAKTGKIAAKQTVGAAGVGANALAYATAQYNGDDTKFVLTHANAYLKFNIKSTDYKGYNLNGVTLWAQGAELSGSAAVADNGALTVSGAEDYVKSTLATPVTVSENDAQALWLAALPADLSGKTVYAIVHMTGVAGTETATHTITLPVKLNGAGNLPAGSVTEIDLPSLASTLAPAWYEPLETRYIAVYGDGWSYGPENTVIFKKYTEAQPVEFKARGNFMKVKEPKYLKVKYLNGLNDCTSPLGIIIDGVTTTTYAAKGGAETYTEVELKNTYIANIQVDNHKYLSKDLGAAGYITALEVKDADHNTIWGTNLWLVLKTITTVEYANGKVMDRNLGVDEKADANTWRATGNYFQWGRPWAFQSQANDYTKKHFTKADAVAVTSLSVSASNPYTLYYYTTTATRKDWYYGDGTNDRSNDLDDLWGNPNGESSSGVKSIYDPCPQGYRVVSPAILKEVRDNFEYNAGGSYPYLSYKGINWGYAGWYTCDGYNSGINWKGTPATCAYWSNSNKNNHNYAHCMEYNKTDATGSFATQYSKARAIPVRCMVDTENR